MGSNPATLMIKNWILNYLNDWITSLKHFKKVCGILWTMSFEDQLKIFRFIVKWYIIIPTYHIWEDVPMFILQNLVIVTVLLTLWFIDDRKRFRWVLSVVICGYSSIYVPGFVYVFIWVVLCVLWWREDYKKFWWFLINAVLYLLVFSFPTPPWV